MSSIQTFRYKRKKLTVIFWDSKIWFELKEICFILKTRKDDGIYKLSFDIPEYMADEDKRLKNKPPNFFCFFSNPFVLPRKMKEFLRV